MGRESVRSGEAAAGDPFSAAAGGNAGEDVFPSSLHRARAAERAELARGLRGLMGKSQAVCRIRRTQADVQLVEYRSRASGAKRLTLVNTATCKSPLCPMCAPRLMEVRSKEITTAITTHGARRTYFLSLTIKHKTTQSIALQHRLLTYSFGRFFSGRKGRELAKRLGGKLVAPPHIKKAKPLNLHELVTPSKKWIHRKPHSIRSHDRTWSREHSFHLHLHCLLFLDTEIDEARVRWLVRRRWRVCLQQTLKTFKQLAERAELEGEDVRDRVNKVFGAQLFLRSKTFHNRLPRPRQLEWVLRNKFPRCSTRELRTWVRRGRVVVGADICKNARAIVRPGAILTVTQSIEEAARRIRRKLKAFGQDMAEIDRNPWEQNPFERVEQERRRRRRPLISLSRYVREVLPHEAIETAPRRRSKSWGHGVHVEQVRHASRIPKYLVKLGCELSGMFSKLGRVSDDGITHYGLWELANIAADEKHP